MKVAVSSLVAMLTAACVPPYRPPAAAEPHAVLKLRRSYEKVAGTSLREVVEIDDHGAYEGRSPSGVAGAPRTDAILVHPIPATARVATAFSHVESHMVDETYQEQVPRQEMESYSCNSGYGTNISYRTCTRMATHYVSETRHRQVMKQVEMPDGNCERGVTFAPQEGHVYLLDYTYQDHHACQLSCFEQVPAAKGTFQNQPCPQAPVQK